ncbi:MAG TPA: tetratricopeptide repeat protein [Methylophilaceae bacterium]|nr:tetratricopeptide repeat protein [Methylophilaceae bacterium]
MNRTYPTMAALTLLLCLSNANAATLEDARQAIEAHDFKTASTIYHELADQGDAKAQYNLGLMYSRGDGVKQNYNEALKWYRLSAEQGFAEAQYNAGIILLRPEWVKPDYAESIKWYTKAAEQGHLRSQVALGVAYLRGEVVRYDPEAAQKWFTTAAEQGDKEAQFDLSSMYLELEGPDRNMVLGYMWLLISSDAAHGEAKRNYKAEKRIRFVESKMTPEQIAEGKKLAQECVAMQLKGCAANPFKAVAAS